jgi:hypothetical protein
VFRRFSETIAAYDGISHEQRGDALIAQFARAPGVSCSKYRENLFGTPQVMRRLADALREAELPDSRAIP